MVIDMYIQREEDMANVGANDNQGLPQDNQVPPLEKVAMSDQVPIVPPPMTHGEIRATFLNYTKP